MAWTRKLPSGLWAATVRLPDGRRLTHSDRSKGVVDAWAAAQETDMRRGDWIDPRAGKITVGECWEKWGASRRLEKASKKRDESHYRCHVEPRWGHVPVKAILQPDVSAWIEEMRTAHRDGCTNKQCQGCKVGAATIQGAVGVLRAILDLAVAARMIPHNAARNIKLPERNAHLDRVLAPEEDELLLGSLDRQFPNRPDARLFVELLLYCGLRWEEAAALDRDHLVMRRQLIDVGPVLERDGTIRPYPKSPAGVRTVGVPDDIWPRLRAHALTVEPGGLLFTAQRGRRKGDPVGVLHYSSWHRRVWQRGLMEVTERGPRGVIVAQRQTLDDPQPTPHDLRHTYGTRLADGGVPVHDIMALMGHETLESAQRYLHSGDDRHDRAALALKRARGL